MNNTENEISNWEKFKIISNSISTIAIPLVLIFVGKFVGNSINESLKSEELNIKYVQIAVNVLNEPPSASTDNLRKWASEVINKHASVELSPEAINELRSNSLPDVGGFNIKNGRIIVSGQLGLTLTSHNGWCYELDWREIPNVSYYSVIRTNSQGQIKKLVDTQHTFATIRSSWYENDNKQQFTTCTGKNINGNEIFHSDFDSLSLYTIQAISNSGAVLTESKVPISSPNHGG